MKPKGSYAVMQQKRDRNDFLEDYPTPPWATRALCERLIALGADTSTCREPAANRGHMVRPLREFFGHVDAADIFDYGAGFTRRDYLFGPRPYLVAWTITNPPFRLAEQFIQRALDSSEDGVAMIVRSAFLEGIGRHERLFSKTPPSHVLQFTERVVMHKGKLTETGSTATAYCWLVWDFATISDRSGTQFEWIAPCRKRLERGEDYA